MNKNQRRSLISVRFKGSTIFSIKSRYNLYIVFSQVTHKLFRIEVAKNPLLGTHLFLLTACRLEYEENIKHCLLHVKPT